jgi:drug/metabolite transporter (DMT)-like permease
MKKWIGTIQVLAAGTGFGFLGIFGRWAFAEGFSVGELLFWRFVFASTILWITAINFRPSMILIRPSQILTSCILGLFGYAVFSNLYFMSIQGVSVGLAAMLLFTFPIFVSLGSHFVLREKMHRLQWLSLLGASVGLMILLWGDIAVRSLNAVIAGLGASIAYSIYVLVSGKVQRNVKPLSSSLYVMTTAAVGQYLFHRPDLSKVLHFSVYQYFLIAGIAVIGSIGPMTLFLAGLQKMKSSQASILVMIEPVVATVAAWLVLGETLSLRQLTGALIVLGSILLNSLSSSLNR